MAPAAGPTSLATAVCLAAFGGWGLWSSSHPTNQERNATFVEDPPSNAPINAREAPAMDIPIEIPLVTEAEAVETTPPSSRWPGTWWNLADAATEFYARLMIGAVLVDILILVFIALIAICCRRRGGKKDGLRKSEAVKTDSDAPLEAKALGRGAFRGELASTGCLEQKALDSTSAHEVSVRFPLKPSVGSWLQLSPGPARASTVKGEISLSKEATVEETLADAVRTIPSPARVVEQDDGANLPR